MTDPTIALSVFEEHIPYSPSRTCRVDGDPWPCSTLGDLAHKAKRADELQASFDLRWQSDMRAIKRWQEAHPGNELVWPDHADIVVWLLEELDRQNPFWTAPAGPTEIKPIEGITDEEWKAFDEAIKDD